MAARSGMSNLITQIRGMTNAGTADYTVAGVSYWEDERLQEVLDRYRVDITREQLVSYPKHVGSGTVEYYRYMSAYNWFEETTGGTAVFIIEAADGTDQGTATYSADYNRGEVTFASDTSGSVYYLTGRSYALKSAAADVWRQKAAHTAASFDFSTDNHSVKRGQVVRHCLDMADMYGGQGQPNIVTLYRSDAP